MDSTAHAREPSAGRRFPAASDDPERWRHLATADEAISTFLTDEHRTVEREIISGGRSLQASPPTGDGEVGGGGGAAADGVLVSPRKGDAVLWYNYDTSGRLEPRAVHCAMPVTKGEKWVANFWISITPAELLEAPSLNDNVDQ